jgi:hypothetical protein
LSESILRSDLIQNQRTKSQYPKAPIAEPVIRTKIKLFGLGGRKATMGDQTMDPHNPIIGVKALQIVVSVMKTNA